MGGVVPATETGRGMTTLTTSQVALIKWRLAHPQSTLDAEIAAIAEQYGASELAIRRIANGYTKRYVQPMAPEGVKP
jgi:DNA-binding MurR/RpiR family transcriptional regulator